MDAVKIAAALRELANLFDATATVGQALAPAALPELPGIPLNTPAAPAAAPKPRGRGKGVQAAAAQAAAPVAAEEAPDPFATTVAVAPAPAATPDDVRAALTALSARTTKDIAVGVLKSFGAENLSALSADKYEAVIKAASGYQVATETDPFEVPPQAPAQTTVTREDVRAALVKAQKRTAVDTTARVLMANGGVTADPEGGVQKPSIMALPESAFAATIAALEALPTTK
jgi:hypothetical protein